MPYTQSDLSYLSYMQKRLQILMCQFVPECYVSHGASALSHPSLGEDKSSPIVHAHDIKANGLS